MIQNGFSDLIVFLFRFMGLSNVFHFQITRDKYHVCH